MARVHALVSVVAIAATAGCGTQTDDTYLGEAIYSLTGTVDNARTQAPPPGTEATIIWAVQLGRIYEENGVATHRLAPDQQDFFAFDGVPVSSTFPAQFTMDVHELPHASLSSIEPDIAYGFISAFAEENLHIENGGTPLVGLSAEHVLAYVTEDIEAGHDFGFGEVLPFALTAGYHLLRVTPNPEPIVPPRNGWIWQWDQLAPADGELVTVRMAEFDDLWVPYVPRT